MIEEHSTVISIALDQHEIRIHLVGSIESQVQIEANQYIPYPLDEISLDFEVLGPSPRNVDMVDILLAASKNENVESRQDALESLGLRARVVDVESFAIANAFELIAERDGIPVGKLHARRDRDGILGAFQSDC